MKSKFATVLFIAAASAAAVPAFGSSSLLTPGGVRYAIVAEPDRPQVQIARAEGDLRATLVAPSTQDAGSESQAQLAYDAATGSLYVAWVRNNAGNAEIRFASVNVDGEWSSPRMVAAGSSAYRNLQFVLSHGEDDGNTTSFLHLAWWSVNGNLREPEYALFAFDGNKPLSADVASLIDLAATTGRVQTSDLQYEEIVNPPLAMARNGAGVDVAFGAVESTVLTRVNVNPRKVGPDVRIWKPLGRGATRTPRTAALVGAQDSAHGVIVNGRLALYTAGDQFRFMVLRKDNTWSDVHAVRVDDENTVQDLVRDLQHTVQELLEHDETESTEEEIASAPADR